MKKITIILLALLGSYVGFTQNDDAVGAITIAGVNLQPAANLNATNCVTTVYNLGTTTSVQTPAASSGTMANDVWFQFTAAAEVAKIKVCSPTTFDAAIEVWNAAATGAAIASANVGGAGAKEYLCVGGLVVGTVYKVRVGRVSGTGAGSFNISYEYLAVEVRNGFYPGPGAAPCYDFNTGMQRSFISYPVGQTRWKFIDASGTVFGPYTLGYLITLSQTAGICEGQTYTVYCELQANDAECGNIWWGYSVPRTIVTCGSVCPTLTANSGTSLCGQTFCNIFNTDFQATYMGAGFQYQFRFVTDNGNVDFCSAWQSTPVFSTSQAPYVNYFRFNKIYAVYARAKKCAVNPAWCGPCIFSSCAIPYIDLNPTNCCRWRNKGNGGSITASPVVGMNQYRFRFSPISISPCPANPLTPIGAAITTNWGASFAVNPAGIALQLGSVYNVQVQGRVLASNVTNCDASVVSLPGQQTDWGNVCLIGIRAATSPPVGTALGCYCVPGMMEEVVTLFDEEYRDESIENVTALPSVVTTVNESGLVLNTSEAGLFGNGVLKIFNMNGQVVLSQNLYAMESATFIEIRTDQRLPTGIYIVSIQSDQGLITDRVFIRTE